MLYLYSSRSHPFGRRCSITRSHLYGGVDSFTCAQAVNPRQGMADELLVPGQRGNRSATRMQPTLRRLLVVSVLSLLVVRVTEPSVLIDS